MIRFSAGAMAGVGVLFMEMRTDGQTGEES